MTGVTVVLLSLILTASTAQTRETLFGCEGETLQLRCPDSTIRVVRANFGRFSVSICNRLAVTNISTRCDTSHTTSSLLRSRCDGRQTCSVLVSQHRFPQSNICPSSTTKYLELQYECRGNKTAGAETETDTPGKSSLVNMEANISKVWSDSDSVLSPHVIEQAVRDGILNRNIPVTEENSDIKTETEVEVDIEESERNSLNSPRLEAVRVNETFDMSEVREVREEQLAEEVTVRDNMKVNDSVLTYREILIITLSSAIIVIIILIITALTVLQLQKRRKGLEPPDLIPMSGTSSSFQSSLESQSQCEESDHINTFNNKFRHFQPEKMSESVSENPSVLMCDEQRRVESLRYQERVTTDPTIYHQQYRPDLNQNQALPHPHFPLLHLPEPQLLRACRNVDNPEPCRDIFINYNITHYHNNILCLACSQTDQLREIQQQSENMPGGPAYSTSETPQYGPMGRDKHVGVRREGEGGVILYNSHLIRQLRPTENLVCDV